MMVIRALHSYWDFWLLVHLIIQVYLLMLRRNPGTFGAFAPNPLNLSGPWVGFPHSQVGNSRISRTEDCCTCSWANRLTKMDDDDSAWLSKNNAVFYANHLGVVRKSLNLVKQRIKGEKTVIFKQPLNWYESLLPWSQWLTTLLSVSVRPYFPRPHF